MEIWKPIPNYNNFYEASNTGKIRSVDRIVKQRNNRKQLKKGKILSPSINRCGYLVQPLSRNNKLVSFTVHKLVAITFLEKPKYKCEINHKDGNKLNNNVDNLEWVTRSDNLRHAVKNNMITYHNGIKHKNSVFNENELKSIRALLSVGSSPLKIAKSYNVHFSTIYRIKNNQTYKS